MDPYKEQGSTRRLLGYNGKTGGSKFSAHREEPHLLLDSTRLASEVDVIYLLLSFAAQSSGEYISRFRVSLVLHAITLVLTQKCERYNTRFHFVSLSLQLHKLHCPIYRVRNYSFTT